MDEKNKTEEVIDKVGKASLAFTKAGCLLIFAVIAIIFSIICFSMCWDNITK